MKLAGLFMVKRKWLGPVKNQLDPNWFGFTPLQEIHFSQLEHPLRIKIVCTYTHIHNIYIYIALVATHNCEQ
ncbi:hypothetical protein GLYMA_18G293400v4 [Glycine max]|uniref:Uncharacterized protein n=1 Tax=Glycine max TaxID=3847 RepID=A0A0R0F5L1_SOYBN|nr:hypothetical protein GYH30_051479 [Glycine max]KRH01703.1 hypothetical protein GLYMA_18G293400v4 [Glycine max]